MYFEFLKMGIEHILDIKGIDHMLFVISLAIIFEFKAWKPLLILITAFTLGHSISLFFSGMAWVNVNPTHVELAIPITIFFSAMSNLFIHGKERKYHWHYLLTALFGLIHGLGFSNFFKAIAGRDDNLVLTLLSFNVGVEIGQLFIVFMVLSLSTFLIRKFRVPQKIWIRIVSILIMLYALKLILDLI